MKVCSRCEILKSVDQFYRCTNHKDGLQGHCKPCSLLYRKEWTIKNPARESYFGTRDARRVRKKVINAFGGKCVVCGFDDWRALQLDHKAGGGRQERKKYCTTQLFRRALIHPDEYQLLCANHNMIKFFEKKEYQQNRNVINPSED